MPFTCILCQQTTDTQLDLCLACFNDLPRTSTLCPICSPELNSKILGNHTAYQSKNALACLYQPHYFTRSYCLFNYYPPIPTLLFRLTGKRQLVYARIFGELIAQYIQNNCYYAEPLPDVIIPVPLHYQRLQKRGYNQALEIARPISKILKIPLEIKAAIRHKHTLPQLHLTMTERQANLNNAFCYQGNLTGKSVAIVDDLISTGATCNSFAQELLVKGAKTVDVWCCARA